MQIPKHIAIIMDGNGRWAKERGLPRTAGHKAGVDRVEEIIRASSELGIKVLTVFAFSNENWARPKKEVGILMGFLDNFLDKKIMELDKNNVKIKFIGRKKPVPDYILNKIDKAEKKTENNTGLTFVLALNYGGRQEIVDAAKKFAQAVGSGEESMEGLDEDKFEKYLYTAGLPDPDLLIRTSGEMRISNFLLWQLSYAEFHFIKKYWPDFKKKDLETAIEEYNKRERRFGGTDALKKNN
jgi:undecaprenyl diphosphate synthase